MQLTDSQVRDLLALWRAFTEQMATLQLERKSLILNLDREYCSIDTAKSCSQRLQMNIEQEFQMYYEVVAAAHLGVRNMAVVCFLRSTATALASITAHNTCHSTVCNKSYAPVSSQQRSRK